MKALVVIDILNDFHDLGPAVVGKDQIGHDHLGSGRYPLGVCDRSGFGDHAGAPLSFKKRAQGSSP